MTTTLEWETQPGLPDHTLTVSSEVRLEGPPWPWASPQEIVDAALEDPDFMAWLAEGSPGCCRSVSFEVVDAPGGVDWQQHGYTGPAPDGTVVISTFPSSVLLDPWTATVLDFFPGYHRLARESARVADESVMVINALVFHPGAHAAVAGYRLLPRDDSRYRTYYPKRELIVPAA